MDILSKIDDDASRRDLLELLSTLQERHRHHGLREAPKLQITPHAQGLNVYVCDLARLSWRNDIEKFNNSGDWTVNLSGRGRDFSHGDKVWDLKCVVGLMVAGIPKESASAAASDHAPFRPIQPRLYAAISNSRLEPKDQERAISVAHAVALLDVLNVDMGYATDTSDTDYTSFSLVFEGVRYVSKTEFGHLRAASDPVFIDVEFIFGSHKERRLIIKLRRGSRKRRHASII